MYLENNDPTALWHQADGWGHIIKKSGQHLGVFQRNMLVTFKGLCASLYGDEREWEKLGERFVSQFVDAARFRTVIIENIHRHADFLFAWNKKMSRLKLGILPKEKLLSLHRAGIKLSGDLYGWAIGPVYADVAHGILSAQLVALLEQKGLNRAAANTAFVHLTTPRRQSFFQREERDLEKIVQCVKNSTMALRQEFLRAKNAEQLPSRVQPLIKKHSDRWQFLGYSFLGRPLSPMYFVNRIKELVKSKEGTFADSVSAHRQPEIILTPKERALFMAVAELTWLKDYRKAALMQYYFTADKINKALAVQTDIDYRDILMMQESELIVAVNTAQLPKNMPDRHKQCVMLIENGHYPAAIITGARATKIIDQLEKRRTAMGAGNSEIAGQVAYPGKIQGLVRVVNTELESRELKEGEVLVAEMTYPDLLPAMKRAAAFVTNTGGITCHAAIVARELKKPCVIGTKVATQILKTGDMVEVDAEQGLVRKI